MRQVLTAALSDPWSALDQLLDGPLHPGGTEATDDLLDRADVTGESRLLDVGCGRGNALERARARGTTAIGLDQQPDDGVTDAVRGDMQAIPLTTDAVDVVLAECVLCLADDLGQALAEINRVTASDGRIAISDVTVEGPTPDLDGPIADLLCLTGDRRQAYLLEQIEQAGFTIQDVGEHRDDLLAMRDRVADRIDYERMLPMLGERGEAMLDGIHDLEAAIEDGRVGYCSVIASVEE